MGAIAAAETEAAAAAAAAAIVVVVVGVNNVAVIYASMRHAPKPHLAALRNKPKWKQKKLQFPRPKFRALSLYGTAQPPTTTKTTPSCCRCCFLLKLFLANNNGHIF